MEKMKNIKYNIYSWKGVDRYGEVIKGTIVSENTLTAETQLHLLGILDITDLHKKSRFALQKASSQKVKTSDVVIFARQIATMVSAGIPLVQALENVAVGFENLKMRAVILSVHRDVTSGMTLADALRKHPLQFDNLICSLVKTGEQSGVLDVVLKQVATYLEKMEILKARVKKALFYPVTVLVVALCIAGLLLTFIVPQFADLFKAFDAELPAATRVVITLSNFLQNYWWLCLGVVVGSIFGFVRLKQHSEQFRYLLDLFSINVMLFGTLIKKAIIARISRTLAITLGSGIPLVDALNCVAGVAGNRVYSNAIVQVRDDVTSGRKIYNSLSATKLFPAMFLQMVNVGEKSGSLEEMLIKVADYFDEQVNTAVEGLSTLIEPIMLILLGAIIGGFVISMYLPIFKLGTIF